MEGIRELIGSLHFESSINLTNVEQDITDWYEKFTKKDKLKTVCSNIWNVIIRLFKQFQKAFEHTNHQEEAYMDSKKILFAIITCFEQILLRCNEIMMSIEVVLVDYISFYKYLMEDCAYEKAAYAILQSLNGKQTESIFVPLERMAEQMQTINSTVDELVFKYMQLQERFVASQIKKVHEQIRLLQNSLLELIDEAKLNVEGSYERVQGVMKGRLKMHTVKQSHSKSWNNPETRKIFLDYYTKLIALCLSCKEVKGVFADLLTNLQSFIHET